MWTRVELKEKAKVILKQNYWKIVLVCAILSLIGENSASGIEFEFKFNSDTQSMSFGALNELRDMLGMFANGYILTGALLALVIGLVIGAFVCNPLEVGIRRFLVRSLQSPADLNELAYGFQSNYKNIVKVMFIRTAYIFCGLLLFIVPGVIMIYEYYMVPYLLAENPNMSREEAFARSKAMMNGQKLDTFILELSFIGWDILASFTFGLLNIFYVEPYRNLTFAALYERLQRGNNGWDVPPYRNMDEI